MKHLLIIYLRNIKNNPKMFLINVLNFSIGIVAVLFITLFVVKEFNADRFHNRHHDIYRILNNSSENSFKYSMTEFPLGKLLLDKHADIHDFVRIIELKGYQVSFENKQFTSQKISFVDRSLFSIFDFKLKAGDFNALFEQPNTLIIDQPTAKLYFNSTDVLGKTLTTEYLGEEEKKTYTIVGILDEYPEESTLKPQMITDIKSRAEQYENDFRSSSPLLFLYIPNCKSPVKLAQKISATYWKNRNELFGRNDPINIQSLTLQPLLSMYLNSSDVSDNLPKGDYTLLWVLVGIGIILLLATLMNYLILTLGLSLKNNKQNQIRYILGGSMGWLKKKFAYESVFYTLITFGFSLLLLPFIHQLISNYATFRYSLFSVSDFKIIVWFMLALIVLGVLCGNVQYALLFNRRNQTQELSKLYNKKPFFRYLIQFQLVIFIAIISGLLVVNRQINFIRDQDLGFDLKNTVSVMINDYENKALFLQECSTYPFVEHTAIGHTLFRNTSYLNEITIDQDQSVVKAQCIFGDHNYIGTYNIKLLSGKNIDGSKLPPVNNYYSYQSNNLLDILVNEEFVKKSGLKDPLGTIITIDHNGKSKGRITGIIQNVRNTPFYNPITPMIIGYGLGHMPDNIVLVKEGKMEEFKVVVDNFMNKINKKNNLGYDIFNFDFEVWYHKEQVLLKLLMLFSFIILAILLLGLLGISLFLTESRTKEIGIRKVNGARISEILMLLNKDFIKWILIAFVIATPIAWFSMHKWLENFAYKTELSWWIFALAGLLALGIALLTVSWQSWRAARRNPVEALRYE